MVYLICWNWKKHPCISAGESSCRCFYAVSLCSIAEDHLPHWELIVTTGMSRVGLSTPVFTPTHLNGTVQAVRLPVDRYLCSSVLRGEDREGQEKTSTHNTQYLFLSPACALFFIHTANTVLLVAPATKRDVNSYSLPFTHHRGSFVFVCGCRKRMTRATWELSFFTGLINPE